MSFDSFADGGDMGKAPAFQFYAADFLVGTRHMFNAEVGLYIRMLAMSWDTGPLPADPARLALVAGVTPEEFAQHWPEVSKKWVLTPEGYINKRLERQRRELAEFTERQAAKGRRSGESRRTRNQPNANRTRTEREPEVNRKRTEQPTEHEPETNSSVFDLQSSRTESKERSLSPRARVTGIEPLVNGSANRTHGQHAWCSLPDRDGLCVPAFLHREFVGKLAATRSEAELRAMYRQTVVSMAGVAIGEDPVKFWRNTFAQWVGTVSSAPMVGKGDKTTRAMAALATVLDRQKAVGDGQ